MAKTKPYARSWLSLTASLLLLSTGVLAHIKNEASQFPDIEFSAARFDIVLLVGAGIVPETPVFEPDKLLSREELASWGALATGLGKGGENPDTEQLASAAVAAGLLNSLEGNATRAELDKIFFDGEAGFDAPDETLSKAEAASLIAANIDSTAGKHLLEQRNLSMGATGTVSSVEVREGHHGNVYVMTVGTTSLPMDAHGRVANGPTDLLQWQGKTVGRSFVHGAGDTANWTYLEGAPPEPEVAVAEQAAAAEAPPQIETPASERRLFFWLLVAVPVLGAALFFRRRKKD